jgi:hypothetical protein
MIRHVVLWKLRSPQDDSFGKIRTALLAQQGKIPGLLRVEVGRNFVTSRRAVDFSLVCDFESREALAAYHHHAAHMETRAIVDPLIIDHWIVDYEL